MGWQPGPGLASPKVPHTVQPYPPRVADMKNRHLPTRGKIVRLSNGATMDPPEYRFKIDAYTPETLPMARLAGELGVADAAGVELGLDQREHAGELGAISWGMCPK